MLLSKFIPVDKSSAIRAFLFSLLTDEKVEVVCGNELPSDVLSALNCLNLFGKVVEVKNRVFEISGKTTTPYSPIDCGNSATMMHLLMGIKVYLGIDFELVGDNSLLSRDHSDFLAAAKLYEGDFVETALAKESAQLKSIHLILMLKNGGKLHFKSQTRRNTEELFSKMGVKLIENNNSVEIFPPKSLHGYSVEIKLDPSSAFIAACASMICKKSFEISDIYKDDSRILPFHLLKNGGFDVGIKEKNGSFTLSGTSKIFENGENIEVKNDQVAAIIDEIPFIAFMVARAGKTFSVRNASWLRNKESDRISETVKRLSLIFETEEFDDGFTVSGKVKRDFNGVLPHSFDHRMEMLSSLIALEKGIEFEINDSYKISFPLFCELLEYLKND